MDPFKELEQFVSQGYFSSEEFKSRIIELCDQYDDTEDSLFYKKGNLDEDSYEEILWPEYLKVYLTNECTKYILNVKRSPQLSRESVLASEIRLLSLIEGVSDRSVDEDIFVKVISTAAETLHEFRQDIFGTDSKDNNGALKLSTKLTVIQLGYLLRMMKDTVFNNNQDDSIYLSKLGALFSTPGSKNVSYNTIIDKSRNPVIKDKEVVYELIVKLQEKIRDEKKSLKS